MDNKNWLNNIKDVAEKFISDRYPREMPMFETFWNVFSLHLGNISEDTPPEEVISNSQSNAIAGISFTGADSLDLMTPIIIATVTEAILSIKSKKLSRNELEDRIASAASRHGAKPGLTECLIRHLPALCTDIKEVSKDPLKTIISSPPEPQYRIWTAKGTSTVDSIEEYIKQKDSYMFFLDLREKTHKSKFPNGGSISTQAVKLLEYLTSRLGIITPKFEIFKNVFDNDAVELTDSDENNIEQQITKLHKYSGNKFRNYLFSNHTEGYGLKESFADKFFFFTRLR
ncbi:MAG: hypothetical protein JXA96_04785 [Sedimentisphaerales bacterium]|nr:hypothetical protein [Sedimentisphaerales bacterium]